MFQTSENLEGRSDEKCANGKPVNTDIYIYLISQSPNDEIFLAFELFSCGSCSRLLRKKVMLQTMSANGKRYDERLS